MVGKKGLSVKVAVSTILMGITDGEPFTKTTWDGGECGTQEALKRLLIGGLGKEDYRLRVFFF